MWYFPFCVVFEVFHYKADTCASYSALSQVPTYAMYTLMPIYFSTVLISHVGESWESTNTRNLWLFWNVLTPLHCKIVWNKLALLVGSPLIYAFCWIRRGSVQSFWPIAAQNGGIWTCGVNEAATAVYSTLPTPSGQFEVTTLTHWQMSLKSTK